MTPSVTPATIPGWEELTHGGLLLDAQRIKEVAQHVAPALPWFHEQELRRRALAWTEAGRRDRPDLGDLTTFVLQTACGFPADGWRRGSQLGAEWGRRTLTGEHSKPRQLWRGNHGAILPVFVDSEPRLGIGRSRNTISHVLQWLRAGTERLALLTNGHQWRLIFAGLDFDAWCQWDIEGWLEQGGLSPQLTAFRTLLAPALWTPTAPDAPSPLLAAILDSRKGQADLSAALGERVRAAVELLVQAHGEVLQQHCRDVDRADIYRAAVRVVMRMVVVLFAESRELLPRDNPLYHGAYGLTGLLEDLAKVHGRSAGRLARSWNAWPRVLALFRLVHQGSHHPALPVLAYGGELFTPGDSAAPDGIAKALAVFEGAAFDGEVLPDRDVHKILELITRTKVRIRQGRAATSVMAPVDFSDLSSEYIGILYEGLLDFELRTAPVGDPLVVLALGAEPALPLSRLEGMDDRALKALLEKVKDTKGAATEEAEAGAEEEEGADAEEPSDEEGEEADQDDDETDPAAPDDDADATDDPATAAEPSDDVRHGHRTRAEAWARRAVLAGGLVRRPRGRLTPESERAHDDEVGRRARQLVQRVVLPGEWYLVRWGGTRKGAGTFYTRPGLAVPTVQRTLRPLAYDPAPDAAADADPELLAATAWRPKPPEQILALKVCDPACGSGAFLVSALRFLCEALYASLHQHGRIQQDGDRALVQLLGNPDAGEHLTTELLPCRPDDPTFEARLKAILRRHVVEHCLYGVDVDPLAVELCRLALWIETMDRTLPFTFLDHKLRCGDALLGTWLDRFRDYPVLAWWRQSPDEKWRGVAHAGDRWAKELKQARAKRLEEQADVVRSQQLLARVGITDTELQAALQHVRALYQKLRDVPASRPDERARIWRDDVLQDAALHRVRTAFDLWTALWFWPLDRLADAPGPTDIHTPTGQAQAIVVDLRTTRRFFHWELEFPDVFVAESAGFDAVVGNPPWEIQKPSSKEFFSNHDPLYRSYGKQEALRRQRELFDGDAAVEEAWLAYVGTFKDKGNFVRYAAEPFGDTEDDDGKPKAMLVARRTGDSQGLHRRWSAQRATRTGCADPRHPFRHQGSADLNTYKLFVEQAHALLRPGGQLGLITPSGLYTDKGSLELRRLLLDHCSWRWLYGFENRDKIFDIHRSFKFAVTIAQKAGQTTALRAAFMRHDLSDWADAKGALQYSRLDLQEIGLRIDAFMEVGGRRDLELLRVMNASQRIVLDLGGGTRGVFTREFDKTTDSRKGKLSTKTELARSGVPIEGKDMRRSADRLWLAEQGWVAVWEGKCCRYDEWVADATIFARIAVAQPFLSGSFPFGFRRIARNTDKRTLVGCIVPPVTPTTYTIEVARTLDTQDSLAAYAVMTSLVLDWVIRFQVSSSVAIFNLHALPLPLGEWSSVRQVLASGVVRILGCPQPLRRRSARVALDAVVAACYGLTLADLRWMLRACDHPKEVIARKSFRRSLDPKGFWRVDKGVDPELRHTVLTLVAFAALQKLIDDCNGDRSAGVAEFLALNNGAGWMLPETLRLADHGIGHDDRAQHLQPVASRLGSAAGWLDWQLAQTPAMSWAECERHAKVILGEDGFRKLGAVSERDPTPAELTPATPLAPTGGVQGTLFGATPTVSNPSSAAKTGGGS